jgi:hypothetical protein
MSAPTSDISSLRCILSHPLFAEGLVAFRQERFFEAHEVWEDLWRQLDSPYRDGIQALIQVAAGFLKLRQGEIVGSRALWRRAATKATRICRDLPALASVFAEAARLADAAATGSLSSDHPAIRIPGPAALLSSISGEVARP